MPCAEVARRAIVRGLGAAFPSTVRLNDAWPESFARRLKDASKRDFTALETAADGTTASLDGCITSAMAPYLNDPFRGAVRRRVLAQGETASQLEALAARRALDDAGIGPGEVDLALITSHMPDLPLPTNGPALQASLGLERAMVLSVDVACASFVAQWILADSLLRTGAVRTILAVQSATMSRFVDTSSPLSVHVGDGATAAIFSLAAQEGRGLVSHWSRTDGSLREGIVLTHVDAQGKGARLFEQAVGPMAFMSLDPASGKRAGIISAQWCREASLGALELSGHRSSELAYFFGPQSIKWLPEACRLSLELDKAQVIESFDEVANISSATIPYNLLLARQRGLLREGALVLLYAPGVGMHRAAAVVRW
jgi:3-oxoacyl-[acyl-carrier-protein] synthase-3